MSNQFLIIRNFVHFTKIILRTVTDAAGMVILKMVMNIAVFTVVEEDVGEDGAGDAVAVGEGGHVVLLAVDRIAPTTTTKRDKIGIILGPNWDRL